jgi:Ran GTPase-activating protein (RanGAP) involved in mRNA processing and transport
VIIEEIMKKGVPRWRLRRALPVKFEDMKKAFGNVKHEYTVGFGEFCVDHDLVISPWEALLDTCAYSYMIAPFKHWQYGWRIWFYVEPISIIFVMRCVNRSLTPDVACLWGAFVFSIFVIYTFLRRPFLYKREEAADVTCRLLSLSQYLGGFLIYNKMVDPLLMDRIFVWSNLYMLFNFIFVWTGFIDRVIEEYKATIAKMDAAVLDFVFAQCDVKSFAFENINVGLQLLMQWDDLVKYQRSTLLLGWTRTNPSNLLGWRERTLLVRWAAIRGMFLKNIRTENGLCILHNAMGKAESDVVRWLLHVHPSLLGVQDDQRDTPVVVALKECAATLLKLEIDPQNRNLLWKRSRYAEILMCEEVQKGKIRWNVHHFKSFNDIAVENLGELTQQLALVYNLHPPPGFQRYAMASKYKPITVAFLAECACVVRSDLELDNCELGDIGSPTFVSMMAALQLRETNAMMKTNFFLSFPIHVRRLVATRNRLAAPAGRALSSMLLHNQTVTLLDLTDNNLDSDAGIAIAEGLKKNETLRYLILARNNMGTEAGQAMASVIKRNRTLVRIDLSFNRMGPVIWWRNRFAKVEIPGAGEAIGDALRVNKHLTELDLSHNECGPTAGDSFAEALRYNHTLTRLDLGANVLTAPGAKNLAFVLGLKNGLVTLNLAQNILGSKTGMVLLRAIRTMPVLTDLDISRNEFGNTVGMSLMEAMQDNQTLISLVSQENKFGAGVTYQLGHMLEKNNTLTSLDLADNDLGIGEEEEEGASEVSPGKALGHGIATNRQLVSLDISGNRFPASELSPIMGAMDANFTLIRLKADNQRFDDVSTLQLAGSIENTRRYLHLDLTKCDIGPRAGTVIGLALENLRKLQVINLSDNALGEKVAKKMAALLSNRKMRISTLRLSNNDFGSEGCMHIIAVIPNNKTLTDLDLSHNGLDRNVALELAENTAIKMESGIIVRPARLKRLNISHNDIGTEAGVAIIEALSTEKTSYLDMSNCDLGPECGEALARGLRSITCGWIELVLEDNKLGKDGVNPMFWAMRRNTSVLSLDLSNNQIGPVFGTDADGVGTYGTSVASFLEMN